MLTNRTSIHTTLNKNDIKKLKKYGNGVINIGIETILKIAETKQYDTKHELLKIAELILNKYEDDD